MRPDADITELTDVFNERKVLLIRVIRRMGLLMRRRISREQCHTVEDDQVEKVGGNVVYEDDESDEEFTETKFKKKQEVAEVRDGGDLVRRMSLDRQNKIESFKELGMFDPFKPSSIEDAVKYINSLDFTREVYPNCIMR